MSFELLPLSPLSSQVRNKQWQSTNRPESVRIWKIGSGKCYQLQTSPCFPHTRTVEKFKTL